MRFLVDANVHAQVGEILSASGHEVEYVNKRFLFGTPDAEIDAVARAHGFIIVSHDAGFLKRIQQDRYNFSIPASSGYGRIMLVGREAEQPTRLEQTRELLELYHSWSTRMRLRFLVTIGPNWIRFDDRPLPRPTRPDLRHR